MILEMDMNLTFLFLEFLIGSKTLYFVMACFLTIILVKLLDINIILDWYSLCIFYALFFMNSIYNNLMVIIEKKIGKKLKLSIPCTLRNIAFGCKVKTLNYLSTYLQEY